VFLDLKHKLKVFLYKKHWCDNETFIKWIYVFKISFVSFVSFVSFLSFAYHLKLINVENKNINYFIIKKQKSLNSKILNII
jgi:hypothetical protein